jgi:hypothetical protein
MNYPELLNHSSNSSPPPSKRISTYYIAGSDEKTFQYSSSPFHIILLAAMRKISIFLITFPYVVAGSDEKN